jgi:energy-coupling factor transporter transmembrane protein EcfT
MTYRYVFHLLGSVTDMYVARRARTVGVQSDVTSGRAFVAASAGALFGKSHALAEEVHMAMLARGYNGNVRTLTPAKVTPRDVAWLAGSALIAVCVIGADLALR